MCVCISGWINMAAVRILCMFILVPMWINAQHGSGALTSIVLRKIDEANREGPYLGLVIPNIFELYPLLETQNYTSSNKTIDFAGRRFRFGAISDKPVILVMTGLGMINAAITAQLLLSFFQVEGVVHFGTAGNANSSLNIGDVVIPQYWAHLAVWNWPKYGQGPANELPLEANGDYTREIGYLKFADYTTNVSDASSYDNLLNNIWYQPEEVFPIDGTPEERQHAFWVPVDSQYFHIYQKLEGIKLEPCVNSTTCLSTRSKGVRVQRGGSESSFLANAAYRTFLHNKFNASPMEKESASVALMCLEQRVPFIALRALSGEGSTSSSDAGTFLSLASLISVRVAVEFIKHLSLNLTWST